ncbi:reverse transcriptase domain, Reverse transcriptase zinc-binding domain protein [Artemisia annua]|uniref:Reverse transcriptase domain, Reverse transcriptase zinc-binding domain protein n=1 Tax=Artemisia annua TaxID=35608 RepID=A0A2U1NA33_ARTAN|nr:reverse transcriptase domain, Reverse transcriptase zinc-binding domain protein [Artemisia annua]
MEWCNVEWFPALIPKQAFILWLLVHERLPTQDRLLKWYPNRVMQCALCETEIDNHGHPFYQCQYSSVVWNKAKQISKIRAGNNSWKEVLDELKSLPNKRNFWIMVKKLVFAASVYFIFNKRNLRLFQMKRKWGELWQSIEDIIRMKMANLKNCPVLNAFKSLEGSSLESDRILLTITFELLTKSEAGFIALIMGGKRPGEGLQMTCQCYCETRK